MFFFPYSEGDFPMTFQIALSASDGWIIASDTLENRHSGAMSAPALRERSHVKKLSYDQTSRTVYTSCGDDLAQDAAALMVETYKSLGAEYPHPDDLKKSLEERANKFWHESQAARRRRSPAYRRLVFIFGHCRPFWTVELGNKCSVKWFYDRVYNGDPNNPAKFFIEKYYDPQNDQSVRELLPLVAHTIEMGAAINRSGIGGLEIMFLQNHNLMNWEFNSPELKPLLARSREIDDMLRIKLVDGRAIIR